MYKSRLFGLKKKNVVEFIKELKKGFSREREELSAGIYQLDIDIETVEKQIEQLKAKVTRSFTDVDEDQLQKRLPVILSWMDAQAEQETAQLKNSFEEEYNARRSELNQLETEIKNGTQLLQRLINQFTKGIEHLNDIQDIQAVLTHEVKSDLPSDILPSTMVQVDSFAAFLQETETKKQPAAFSSFWEDSEAFLHASVTNSVPIVKQPAEVEEGPKTSLKEQEQTTKAQNEEMAAGPDTVDVFRVQTRAEEVHESEEIQQEIDSIKKRYIIGKIAGADLLDGEGRLIIRKNETITEETLLMANRAGVLADLIVHMKIPGLGESSNEQG